MSFHRTSLRHSIICSPILLSLKPSRYFHFSHSFARRDRGFYRYECTAAEDLVQRDVRFDVVVASEVIEHVQDPVAFVKTLSQLMQPDGLLCLTTLNRTLTSLVGAIWMAEYVLNMVPQGTHDWAMFLTPGEMAIAARQAGLKLDVLTGMQWNPITQKWRLSDDTSINYAAAFVKKPDISTEAPAKPESEETVQQSEETNKTEV